MNEYLYALFVGFVQGVTEFLPVSSSAHLILTSYFFGEETMPLSLNIALHLGTVIAVLIYFHKDWLRISMSLYQHAFQKQTSFESSVLFPALIIGSVPAGVIGLLWQDDIERIFHHPLATLIPLALVGITMWLGDNVSKTSRTLADLTLKDAIIIGVAQACALIPGTSRSGATILAGRVLSLKREDAARFSFLLGTPAMGGAAMLNAGKIYESLSQPAFYLGLVSSAIVGCFAIGFLLRFLRRYGFLSFAIYRVTLAVFLAMVFYR